MSGDILIDERATLRGGRGLTWLVAPRGGQSIETRGPGWTRALGGRPRLEVFTRSACQGPFSYVRGAFSFDADQLRRTIAFELELTLANAPGVVWAVALYEDPRLTELIHSDDRAVSSSDGHVLARLDVDFGRVPLRGAPVFGFVQVCLPRSQDARVALGRAVVRRLHPVPPLVRRPGTTPRSAGASLDPRRRFRFEAVGDERVASSRLRVWKVADALLEQGHDVRVGCGGRGDIDVLVCQKVRPFATVAALREANARALVVYDIDDDITLDDRGDKAEVIAFINSADIVTCGSEHLANKLRAWHPEVHVLENPIDISDESPVRPRRGHLGRLCWFGSPEGLDQLVRLGLRDEVTTLTRGGDIEFNIDSIDRNLTQFDLALLPVEPTPWNLAKNANRMIKAIGLGLPVLASSTPEHERAAETLGLPRDCLVPAGADWSEAIANVRAVFPRIEQATHAAREKARERYSTGAMVRDLLAFLETVGAGERRRSSSPALSRIAVFLVDGSPDARALRSLDDSRVEWSAFESVRLFSAHTVTAADIGHHRDHVAIRSGDFHGAYKDADRALEECAADFVLVVPPGVALSYGFAGAAATAVDDASVVVFARHHKDRPSRVGLYAEPPLRSLFLDPTPPGPLLVRTSWAREHAPKWESSYDHWPWAALLTAWSGSASTRTIETPFAFDAVADPFLPTPRQYAEWLKVRNPEAARDLPDPDQQWRRLMTDLITNLAVNLKDHLPALVGPLYGRTVEQDAQLARTRQVSKIR